MKRRVALAIGVGMLCAMEQLAPLAAESGRNKTEQETLDEANALLDKYSRVQKRLSGEAVPEAAPQDNIQYIDPVPKLGGSIPSTMILPTPDKELQKASQALPKTDVVILKNGLQLDGVIKNRDSSGGFWLETDPGFEIYFSKEEVDKQYKIK